jgi:hypothetical protein
MATENVEKNILILKLLVLISLFGYEICHTSLIECQVPWALSSPKLLHPKPKAHQINHHSY